MTERADSYDGNTVIHWTVVTRLRCCLRRRSPGSPVAPELALSLLGAHRASMNTLVPTAEDLVGSFRTFGAEGPAYQVLHNRGEEIVRVRVLETGEELDYPTPQAIGDPEAR